MPDLPAAGHPHLLDASMFWGPTGGVRRVLSAKQAGLTRAGWRHTLFAPGARGPGCIDCGGLPLPSSGGYRVVLRRSHAADLMVAQRPDIVEAADPYLLGWAALDAAVRLRVPAVAFCHSNLPALAARLVGGPQALATRRGRWAASRARSYLARLYAGFDMVLAPSLSMVQRLHQWGVPRALHQPLGVDCAVFSPAARDPQWRQRIVRDLGLSSDTRLLVYTGRFAPEKNLALLTQAVALLGPGHALLAVGSGPCPPRGDRVILVPPVNDKRQLARLVASGDVYVHAGDQETFGLGVLEAMACGTPVIASAAGGLGELVQDAGIAVQRPTAVEWAEAISDRLGGDRVTHSSLNALSRARAHDWTLVVGQWAQRYRGLMQRHAGHAVT